MDTKDRFCIFAAAAVALAAIALSAFIVAFAPEDPYMPPARAALRSGGAASTQAGERADERRDGNPRNTGGASQEMRSDRGATRMVYAAGGAAVGIAMMFAVMGWLDRGATARAAEGDGGDSQAGGPMAFATEAASGSAGRDDNPDVGATVAMIALGFGAFIGRSRETPQGHSSRAPLRDLAAPKVGERSLVLRRLAAGYGAADLEAPFGDNRRRADRRNPLRARPAGVVERRSAARRITDAACEPGFTMIRGGRALAGARAEMI